jgi:ATP dependent DNA ligase C terminal region
MNSQHFNFDEDRSDDSRSLDGQFDSALAVMEPASDDADQAEQLGPMCEKCEAPLKSDGVTICRSCGWYPSLGICVEVDPDWETENETSDCSQAEPRTSHLEVWLNLLPRWAWIIIASVAGVVVESIVGRLITPAEMGGLRTTWSLTQLGVGMFVFAICHIFNFLTLIASDSSVGFLDILSRPLKLWMRTAERLPQRLRLVNTAACSLTAALMSVLVIGALPYERLWDWGFEPPVKQNLMGAVMNQAKKLESGKGADNLEDAVGDFAGSQNLEPAELPTAPPEKPRERADCVILGYETNRDGQLTTLVVGSAHRGKLVFAGKVHPELDEAELSDLLANLESIKSNTPFLPMQSDSAVWVQPKYTCRVSYSEKARGGQLREMKWDRLGGTMSGL